MKKKEQIAKLKSFFQQGEQKEETIGMEVEHFVIKEESLEAVDYDDEFGISDILKNFDGPEIEQYQEGEHLLKLVGPDFDITIEPGGQLEVGILPQSSVEELMQVYFDFLNKLIPILNQHNYLLVTFGYQPQSKIDEISWLPKKRYKIMADYLGQQGKYAHNMMKGTAAFQLALDYKSESDFIRKFRVATVLSPVLSILCDNAPFFEGQLFSEQALRNLIWDHTDDNRAGIVKEAFASDFGYRKYAEYILSRELILLKSGGEYTATENLTVEEIFSERELGEEELEHILTMVFPDVRAKQFIEIRMTDSVPPQCFLAVASFWKGILYNDENLNKAVEFIEQFDVTDIINAKQDIIDEGLKAKLGQYSILEVADKFLTWAQAGLGPSEEDYLNPLQEIVSKETTLAQQLKKKAKEFGKRKVVADYSLNSLVKEDEIDGKSLFGL